LGTLEPSVHPLSTQGGRSGAVLSGLGGDNEQLLGVGPVAPGVSTYTVGFVGTGPDPDDPVWGESAAMAYRHAAGYERLEECRIVGCADVVREHAADFADHFDVPTDRIFEDAVAMVETVEPDIVSVSTPVPTHASIVLDLLATGTPAAIHCEKPMADTWGDARTMAQEAWRQDVQLTFNHQRRMASPWRDAKRVLEAGHIGDLQRIEVTCKEILDNGTHYVDLANMYTDGGVVRWVLGNVDYRLENVKYGTHNENHGLGHWAYDDGVRGVIETGDGAAPEGAPVRLVGTDGRIEVDSSREGAQALRYRGVGTDGWETAPQRHQGASDVELAIEHVVQSLDRDVEPELSARRALAATEVLFGIYESSRRRGRVEFPLTVEDNPLEAMVEDGSLHPTPADEAE
jgi:predicted dehydrogenase